MIARALLRGAEALSRAGVPEPLANAEFLLAHVLGCKRSRLSAFPGRPLSSAQKRRFGRLVLERGRRTPLAYILGSQPFLGADIRVTPAVLIPRPETEQLVEAAVRAAPGARAVLEIGTGSGCAAVALALLYPKAVVVATDVSPRALALAEGNARRNGVHGRVRFLREDLFRPGAPAAPPADLLLSNPPYIRSSELSGLEPEVLREPRLALDGGPDGLGAIRAICASSPGRLGPGGVLALEIGDGQAAAVGEILAGRGFERVEVLKDFQGIERIVLARRPRREMIQSGAEWTSSSSTEESPCGGRSRSTAPRTPPSPS
jgi:release factor glutamine methyltransferase